MSITVTDEVAEAFAEAATFEVAAAVEADRQTVNAAHQVADIAAHPNKGARDIWAAARKALQHANTAVAAWSNAETVVAAHTSGSCDWAEPVLPASQPSGAMSLVAAQLQQVVKDSVMAAKRQSRRRIKYAAPADTGTRVASLGCPLMSCAGHSPIRETASEPAS